MGATSRSCWSSRDPGFGGERTGGGGQAPMPEAETAFAPTKMPGLRPGGVQRREARGRCGARGRSVAMAVRERAELVAAGEVRLSTTWARRLGERLEQLLRAAGLRGGRRGRPRVRVLEQVSLGGRRQLFLVACAGERYLVGAGSE